MTLEALAQHLETGPGAEPYRLRPGGVSAIVVLLEADPKNVSEIALKLVVALEESLGSPNTAQEIVTALRSSPAALRAIRERYAGSDRSEALDALLDQRKVVRAPMHGVAAPDGAVSLRSFLDVGRERRPTVSRARPAAPAPAPRTTRRRAFRLA